MTRTRYGAFQVIDELGRGGMATVYRAISVETGRDVALKVCRSDDEDFIERFVRESHAIRALRHRNVIRIVDVGPRKPPYWYAMELIQGPVLKDYLAGESPPRLPDLVDMGLQVAEALDMAHQAGIFHRDLKPSNVLVEVGGRAVLTDFGLAKFDDFAQGYTRSGMLLGTFLYMAPEQMDGRFHGAATDIYQLGLLLYEMFTGGLPFAELGSVRSMVTERFRSAIPSIRSFTPRLSSEVDDLVLRCLETESEKRPSSADMVATLLRRELRRLREGGGLPAEGGGGDGDATVIRRKEADFDGSSHGSDGAASTTLEPIRSRARRKGSRMVLALLALAVMLPLLLHQLRLPPFAGARDERPSHAVGPHESRIRDHVLDLMGELFREETAGFSLIEGRRSFPGTRLSSGTEEQARRVLASLPQDPVALDQLARSLLLRRRYGEARQSFETLMKVLPDDLSRRRTYVQYSLGKLDFLQGDHEGACVSFSRAHQKARDWELPRFGLAMAYLVKGNPAVAMRYLREYPVKQALRLTVGQACVHLLRGRPSKGEVALCLDGDAWKDPLIERAQGQAVLLQLLAMDAELGMDWERSLRALVRARALWKGHSLLHQGAFVLGKLRRFDEEARWLEEALQVDAGSLHGWILLARSSLRGGRVDRAKTARDRVLAMAAEDPSLVEAWAEELLGLGRKDWAELCARRVVELDPDDLAARRLLASLASTDEGKTP